MTNAPDISIKKHLRVFRKDAQQIIYLSLKKTKKKTGYILNKKWNPQYVLDQIHSRHSDWGDIFRWELRNKFFFYTNLIIVQYRSFFMWTPYMRKEKMQMILVNWKKK